MIRRDGYVVCPACLDESVLIQIVKTERIKNEFGFSDDLQIGLECEFGHQWNVYLAFDAGHIKLVEGEFEYRTARVQPTPNPMRVNSIGG